MIPNCKCGCGQRARIVADVYLGGIHDCRAPWMSIDHAVGAHDEGLIPKIDVVIDERLFPIILDVAPCWCRMREFTVCMWCPEHGYETSESLSTGESKCVRKHRF